MEQQYAAAELIVKNGLSVREVEKLVKSLLKPAKEKQPKKEEKDLSFIFQDLEERMKSIMGTKVMIHRKDKSKGRIEIEYYSEAELERLVELIMYPKLKAGLGNIRRKKHGNAELHKCRE